MDVSAPGALAVVTVQKVVQFVDETFGGTVVRPPAGRIPPAPTSAPWTGKGRPVVTESSSSEVVAEPLLTLEAPRRPSCSGGGPAFGGLHAVRDVDLGVAAARDGRYSA